MILLFIFFGKPQIIYQCSGQRKGAVRYIWMFHLCLRFHMLSSANLMLLLYLKTSLSYRHASRSPNRVLAGAGSVHRFAM